MPDANPLAEARDRMAAHLATALASTRLVVSSSIPDVLMNAGHVVVASTSATWSQHRDLVDVEATIYVPYESVSRGDIAVTDATGEVYGAVRSFADDPFRWAGPGTATTSDLRDEGVTIDGVEYAIGRVGAVVVHERPAPHQRGPLEGDVYTILATAGLPAVDVGSYGDHVITRYAGSAPGDPWYDSCGVWSVADYESGRVEALSRRVFEALYSSDAVTVASETTVDLAGTPPSGDLVHEVAELMVRGNQQR